MLQPDLPLPIFACGERSRTVPSPAVSLVEPWLKNKMRTLAIDLGSRRIGLALSDFGGALATPHDVLFVTDPIQAIAPLLNLIEKEDIKRIVVGLPLNMDGSPSPAAHAAVKWARTLETCAIAKSHNVQLIFVDERLSSFDADQQLAQRRQAGENLTHKKKKQQQDAIAAAGFLQAFLDGKLPAIDLPK
jgi:putative Holliday junction resolvase